MSTRTGNSGSEERARRRKVIALVAGLDLLVGAIIESEGDPAKRDALWAGTNQAAHNLTRMQWNQLADRVDILPPSDKTIEAVKTATLARMDILRRWDNLNHGNDVRAGW
jgi:hypothetical protein